MPTLLSPEKPTPARSSPTLPAPKDVSGLFTAAEFYVWDEKATEKYQLIEGKIILMPGSLHDHNYIQTDFLVALSVALKEAGSTCEVISSDQKIHVSDRNVFYPDVIVVCGETVYSRNDGLQNPVLLVEVLSPSTARFDRGKKLKGYQTIASLRHYVLVEQDFVSVTHYEKNAEGIWTVAGVYENLTDRLPLVFDDAQIAVPLSAIYRRVSFDE